MSSGQASGWHSPILLSAADVLFYMIKSLLFFSLLKNTFVQNRFVFIEGH